MERLQAICLLSVGVLITVVLAYVDEAYCRFKFLEDGAEALNVVAITCMLVILPISLFYAFRETRLKKYSFVLALSGYVPSLLLITSNLI